PWSKPNDCAMTSPNAATPDSQNWGPHDPRASTRARATARTRPRARANLAACPPDLPVHPVLVGVTDFRVPDHELLGPRTAGLHRSIQPVGGPIPAHHAGIGGRHPAGSRRPVCDLVVVLPISDQRRRRPTALGRHFPPTTLHAPGPAPSRRHCPAILCAHL